MTKQNRQSMSLAETEFKKRLKEATRIRRKWIYASEVAGDLCYAAKPLRKVADPERRFDLLCDFIFKGSEMLKIVDDSNASLQSVFWSGDIASELWDEIAPLVEDKGRIVRFLLRLFDEGWDRIAIQSILEWPNLYLPEEKLREFRDALLTRARTAKKTWDKQQGTKLAAKAWAHCRDLDKFDAFVQNEIGFPLKDFLYERIDILEASRRWDEAIALCRKSKSANFAAERILEIARKMGDSTTLRSAYEAVLEKDVNSKTVRQAKQELPEAEFSEMLQNVFDRCGHSQFLDPEFAKILLDCDARERLREYVLRHAGDDICKMTAITGYFPLGTALAKANEPLLATVPIRLGILYLMSQRNSRYYPTVHRKMYELAVLASRIDDWEPIQSHADFERGFEESFASRRSYW